MSRIRKVVIVLSVLLCIVTVNACSEKGRENTKQSVDSQTINSQPVNDQPVQTKQLTIERHPAAADFSSLYGFGKREELPNLFHDAYDIRSTDLTACDLTKEYSKLLKASFDSKTVWPDKLPENFDPDNIMELYKNPGLHIRSLHEQGITGKGVGIAIIDQPLLVDHIEYRDRLKYYSERITVKDQDASMHGAAVASIAVGNSVGVAPEAELYYIAEDFELVLDDYGLLAEAINKLLDLNETLPVKRRIRVISISWGVDYKKGIGTKPLNEAYQRAKEEGVLIITTSIFKRENMAFFGLDKYPLSDPDDFNSYTKIPNPAEPDMMKKMKRDYNISVPMNYRCTASPTGKEDYVVYREGGLSWAAPYVAGVYALACQVKPEITYEEFWKLAALTARTSHGSYEGEEYEAPYIIDPAAIIKELKKE